MEATESGKKKKKQKGQKKPSLTAAMRRARSFERLKEKKDRRVFKSSHGKFKTVAALEDHRKQVTRKSN
jgi:hypothetical protein